MLVHKGGQINNVQLITGLRIAENGSYCENVKKKGEEVRGEGGGGMCTKIGSYCEKEKKVSGGGGGGGVRSGGVRVDGYGELKLL